MGLDGISINQLRVTPENNSAELNNPARFSLEASHKVVDGLSQGQKQRLAIARALYTDPDILILDEATSALDLKTEEEFCEVLKNLKGEKTIIAIAHRLSTIRFADKIVFMENGKKISDGSFSTLIKECKEFEDLVNILQGE